ncbi:MAG TPA: hypothetical protein VFZ65_06985, partial [Planctomycetota bacterium]|nr:hypothetical protein [Planctomycetota bacterium]
WHDLFAHWYDGEVTFRWPWPTVFCGLALLLAPWVWAIGTWLPSGRMAIGGTALFVLVLGLCVTAVLRQCPNLELGIAWQGWLWAVVPLGLATAALSWTKGRRGGGAPRSARFGLAAVAVGLVPPSAWLADEAWHYHHPDLQRLQELSVYGTSPDLRYVLARGGAHEPWSNVPVRIDLSSGAAEQLGGIDRWFHLQFARFDQFRDRGALRYWLAETQSERSLPAVFDLTTGKLATIAWDATTRRVTLPADLQARIDEERFLATPFRAPGNRRVALQAGEIVTEEPDGTRSHRPWPADRIGLLRPAGHGIRWTRQDEAWFDLTGREIEASKQGRWGAAFCVRDRWVFVPRPKSIGRWHQLEANGDSSPCDALHDATVLGLFDDDTLLCAVLAIKGRAGRLFLYQPADRSVVDLPLPDGVAFQMVEVEAPLRTMGSLLPRDGSARIWLSGSMTPAMRRLVHGKKDTLLLVDTATRAVSACAWQPPSWWQLLGWPDPHSALVLHAARIDRVDTATGARTRLFPNPDAGGVR